MTGKTKTDTTTQTKMRPAKPVTTTHKRDAPSGATNLQKNQWHILWAGGAEGNRTSDLMSSRSVSITLDTLTYLQRIMVVCAGDNVSPGLTRNRPYQL
jgi:hypothetical protein